MLPSGDRTIDEHILILFLIRHDDNWFSQHVSRVDNFIEVSPGENYLKYALV
jgi:hypothetical protein